MERVAGDEPSFGFLHASYVNFTINPPRDPDRLLIRLRNGFAKSGIDFAAFDFAVALHWATNQSEEPLPVLVKPAFAVTGLGEAADDAAEDLINSEFEEVGKSMIDDFAAEIPGLRFFFKQGRRWFVNRARLETLRKLRPRLAILYEDDNKTLRPPHELAGGFVTLFLEDLNRFLNLNPDDRFVIFADEYEQLFSRVGEEIRYNENPLDQRLKLIVEEANGLLISFFQRERLHWEEDFIFKDRLENSQCIIGGLSEDHARETLISSGIEDTELQQAIINGALESIESGAGVYPLLLELQVEYWEQLKARGKAIAAVDFATDANGYKAKLQKMLKRVMRHYGAGIREIITCLATTNRFDFETINAIADKWKLAPPQVDALTNVSFLTKGEDGWFTLHRAASDAILETISHDELVRNRCFLLDHFADRVLNVKELDSSIDSNVLSAFSEANALRLQEGSRGYVDWLEIHSSPLALAQKYALLNHSWEQALAIAHDETTAEPLEIAACFNEIGWCLEGLGNVRSAISHHQQALELRQNNPTEDPDKLATALNNLGKCLTQIGDIKGAESNLTKALNIWQAKTKQNRDQIVGACVNLSALNYAQGDYEKRQKIRCPINFFSGKRPGRSRVRPCSCI